MPHGSCENHLLIRTLDGLAAVHNFLYDKVILLRKILIVIFFTMFHTLSSRIVKNERC